MLTWKKIKKIKEIGGQLVFFKVHMKMQRQLAGLFQ